MTARTGKPRSSNQRDDPTMKAILGQRGKRLVILKGPHRDYLGEIEYGVHHAAEGAYTLCGIDLSRERYDMRHWVDVDSDEIILDSPCQRCTLAKQRRDNA